MNPTIQNIIARRAIRHYKPDPIPEEDLTQILECGLWAPSAGGKQPIHMLVSSDAEANLRLGRICRDLYGNAIGKGGHDVNLAQISIAEDATILNGFYDAPTVVMLFAPGEGGYQRLNAMAVAENLMIAAKSLGVGSAFISRAEKTMQSEEGKALMARADIPETWVCLGFVLLGYCDGEEGEGVPRNRARIHRVG